MKDIAFISDLHLCEEASDRTTAFLRFLYTEGPFLSALYILGDLFEAWVGDDAATAFHHTIYRALSELVADGVKVFVMPGNRDFLLGPQFAELSGVTLLPDPTVIEVGGRRWLLAHGDAYCTEDKAHQRFRRVTQNRLLQHLFLLLPCQWRQAIGRFLRRQSEARQGERRIYAGITDSAIEAVVMQTRADVIIHGHIHVPGMHELPNMAPIKRWVLGEWKNDGGLGCI